MENQSERTSRVSNYLSKSEVHIEWETAYRTQVNEQFYEQAFDFIAGELGPSPHTVLDVGCGPGFHSTRLARRGFRVVACDFSPPVLEMAASNFRAAGVEDKITLAREDILNLSFANDSQECVLCWGVLMHIPEVSRAIAELCRVLKPGGTLVLAENNAASLQCRVNHLLRKLLQRPVARTATGLENWQERENGTLLTRTADMGWLVGEFASNGVVLRKRVASQFTEAYVKVPKGFIEQAVHRFNAFWFHRVRWPGPAFGNLLFFDKGLS